MVRSGQKLCILNPKWWNNPRDQRLESCSPDVRRNSARHWGVCPPGRSGVRRCQQQMPLSPAAQRSSAAQTWSRLCEQNIMAACTETERAVMSRCKRKTNKQTNKKQSLRTQRAPRVRLNTHLMPPYLVLKRPLERQKPASGWLGSGKGNLPYPSSDHALEINNRTSCVKCDFMFHEM